jgi:ADP-ribose pyrophosphatase
MNRPDQQDKAILAEGHFSRYVRRGTWEYVERINISGIVVLVAVTPERELLLVEQYRPPMDGPVIELPAGLVGDTDEFAGEQALTAARRELIEETGFDAEHFEIVAEGPPTAGLVDEVLTMVRATGLRKVGDGGGDETESITVHVVPLAQINDFLASKQAGGTFIDLKIFSGLYFAASS